jgi:hypothetical protein
MKTNYPLYFLVTIIMLGLLAGTFINGAGQYLEIDLDNEVESTYTMYLPLIRSRTGFSHQPSDGSWSMLAANPERTSWTSEEVPGKLNPVWYKPIEPYIPMKAQIIAAYGNLYVSTSAGLYVLDAETGAEKWVYATSMPLGHSPTIDKGIVYVGGFDRKIHAVDAATGKGLWTFEAGQGFDTNPLIVNGVLYAGNRDGYFYAIHTEGPSTGKLFWKYKTQGPIQFSAALKDGIVYFASNDSHAYALNAHSGDLVWKSKKLPGAGFHSWWPVIYQDWVIFAGSNNYRFGMGPGPGALHHLDRDDIFPNKELDPKGTYAGPVGEEPGDWAAGTPTIDTSKSTVTENGKTTPITEYFEEKPWRRTVFVLDRFTGTEYITDFDNDGKPEYAPFLWFGSDGAGNRYPPIVGGDGVLYMTNMYLSHTAIPGGNIVGWKIRTPFISIALSGWGASDEPEAYTAGGNLIYRQRCCDRAAGAFDLTIPSTEKLRSWSYFSYNLPELIPGYNIMTHVWEPYYKPYGGVYGGRNGSYGWHGDVNAPIPYEGKVYIHVSNAILAMAPQSGTPVALPIFKQVAANPSSDPAISEAQIKARLASEVQKMIEAGHLRPGYSSTGHFDRLSIVKCGDDLADYWHYPGDTILTLIRALPHLPPDLQGPAKSYIQSEFNAYPPYLYNHIGWKDGAGREAFDLPPETIVDLINYSPRNTKLGYPGWRYAPHQFYAMWKYAEVFGGAKTIFDAAKGKLEEPPDNDVLKEMPHAHNAYIAGYIGYLELEKLAGYPQTGWVQSELNRLLQLRSSQFSKDTSDAYFTESQKYYCRALNVSRNFMYLVPELAQYLHDNNHAQVKEAIAEYTTIAPLWFVAKAETAFAEDVINHLYDYHALFQAKAMILNEPRSELARYLDVPSMAVGDLFYIENLIAILGADGN